MPLDDDLAPWRESWSLTEDGDAFETHSSRLQPVLTKDGAPAMLKLAYEAEERRGGAVMAWFDEGAAKVFAYDDRAVLLERLIGEGELADMAAKGRDDEATAILCRVAMKLHKPSDAAAPLVDLERWFEELPRMAARSGAHQALLTTAWETAVSLFSERRPKVALHGDMHHGNALRTEGGEWRAIDPKGLSGDAAFDYANILNNPWRLPLVHAPGRLRRQTEVIAAVTGEDLVRVLRWTSAYSSLSAAWTLADGADASHALGVARIAQAELAAIA